MRQTLSPDKDQKHARTLPCLPPPSPPTDFALCETHYSPSDYLTKGMNVVIIMHLRSADDRNRI